jgi:hypothetical protein
MVLVYSAEERDGGEVSFELPLRETSWFKSEECNKYITPSRVTGDVTMLKPT